MGKLICPLCGVYTSFALARSSEVDIGPQITDYPGLPNYAILSCQACENRFVAEKVKNEWLAVFPLPHKQINEYIPEPIRSEFEEANLCFTVRAFRASVSMCSAALEAMWREQGVSGLKELKEKGIISKKLFKQADQVRRWANVAKHEPIHEAVTSEEVEQLLSYLEKILDDVYIEEKQLSILIEKLERVEQNASNKAKTESKGNLINLEFVKRHWKTITESLKGEGDKGNLDAFMRSSCEPIELNNGTLTLGFYHKFHFEYMQERNYPTLLETKISEVLGIPIKVKYVLFQKSRP